MINDNIEQLKSIIFDSKNLCVFTGAGISVPSGISDFRSTEGLYSQTGIENYSPEQIVSHTFFMHHSDLFYSFYKAKMLYQDAKPNEAHCFFAELENQRKNVMVVTQNIDGRHQLSGSTKVAELHGSHT